MDCSGCFVLRCMTLINVMRRRGLLKRVLYLLEIRLRKLVDEREKMIEQVGQ